MIFLVQQSDGLTTTQMITAPVEGLAAGAAKKLSVTWDTTGVEEMSYRVLGYVKFCSQTTEHLFAAGDAQLGLRRDFGTLAVGWWLMLPQRCNSGHQLPPPHLSYFWNVPATQWPSGPE